MPRLPFFLALSLLLVPSGAGAQQMSAEEIDALLERGRRLGAIDENGCAKYPVDDEIVVCGAVDDDVDQRPFKGEGSDDENRLRKGEAVSTVRAACCSPIPKLPAFVGMGFGYVPPLMVPYEELMKGLPDPKMIVTEGSEDTPSP